MATSGQFLTTCSGTSGHVYNVWVVWNVNSQSAIYNSSNITVSLYLQRNDSYSGSAYNLNTNNPVKLYVGGELKVDKTMAIDTRNNVQLQLATWSGTVGHNGDGSLSLYIDGQFTMYGVPNLTGGQAYGTAYIDSVDRSDPPVYCNVDGVGTDRLTIHGSSDAYCNLWDYSIDGGSFWVTYSGATTNMVDITLTGLSPNTQYNCRVRARKASNYLFGYSGTISVTTIGTSVLNWVSGFAADSPTVTFNVSITGASNSFKHYLYFMDGADSFMSLDVSFVNRGTETRSFTLTPDQRNTLLQYMSNKKSLYTGFCLYTYSSDGYTYIGSSWAEANITTSEYLSKPTIGIVDYYDGNPTTTSITGNNKILIQGFSNMYITSDSAIPKNWATIKSYTATLGNMTVSSSGPNLLLDSIYASGELTLAVTVTDSRGYSNSYYQVVTILPYEHPSIPDAHLILRRENNIGTNIIFSFDGSICSLPINSIEKNEIIDVKYRLKKTNEDNYSSYVSILSTSHGIISGLDPYIGADGSGIYFAPGSSKNLSGTVYTFDTEQSIYPIPAQDGQYSCSAYVSASGVIEYDMQQIVSSYPILPEGSEPLADFELTYDSGMNQLTITSLTDTRNIMTNPVGGFQINGLTFNYSSDMAFSLETDSSYDLELVVVDKLLYYPKDLIVPRATPEISIRKGMVGIHNPTPTATLDVGGSIKANGLYSQSFVRMLSNDDLNNIKDGGIYGYFILPGVYFDSSNLPTNVEGLLEVVPTGDSSTLYTVIQRYTTREGTIYQRIFFIDQWSNWIVVTTKDGDITTELYQHTNDRNNPHQVTKDQLGLYNVDNTSDMNKPVSGVQQAAINAAADKHYTHEQTESSSMWVCPHNLGKRPAVIVTDSAGTQIIGSLDYPDLNTVVIRFKAPFTGRADFN